MSNELSGKRIDSCRRWLRTGGDDRQLRVIPLAVQFVKTFVEDQKAVAAICHGPWMLVEADVVRGRTLTSWPSLKTVVRNAGGNGRLDGQ